jgi:uncharacterized protein (DUF433 family)
MVYIILSNIAAGISREEIYKSYPSVSNADIDAALAYAAELVRGGAVDLPREVTA